MAKATDFFPIPYSLFPKKPSPFHMGSYFGKVPPVESLSQKSKIFASSHRPGAFGVHRPKPPLPKGGASATPRRGDSAGKACGTSYLFPLHYSLKTFPFPHGLVLWESPHCESLSQKSKIFASSLWQGSLWGAQTKAPLAKGGCLGLPRRGDSVAKATDFFPIPSSLFPKKPSPFHMGWYLRKVPTVNPSVTAAPCQLPLTREPLGCSDEAPLAKGGCLGTAEAGGFRGQSHGLLPYSLFPIP